MSEFWIALFFFLLLVNLVLAILIAVKKPKKTQVKPKKKIDFFLGFRKLFSGGMNT
jgi:hypothetical protein